MTEISPTPSEKAGFTSVVTAETRQILEEGSRLPETQSKVATTTAASLTRRPKMPCGIFVRAD